MMTAIFGFRPTTYLWTIDRWPEALPIYDDHLVPVDHVNRKAVDHWPESSPITPASIQVACSEKIDPTHAPRLVLLALIESPRENEQIRRFRSGCGQRLYWAGEELRGETVRLQYGGESGCDDRFIVHDENSWDWAGRHVGPLPSSLSVNNKSASNRKLAFRVISQPQSTGEGVYEQHVPLAESRALPIKTKEPHDDPSWPQSHNSFQLSTVSETKRAANSPSELSRMRWSP
jgi:hypothetical protein